MDKREQEFVINSYEKIAKEFHNTRHRSWDWIYDFLEKQKNESKILDVGCGGGRNMKVKIPEKNLNFYGIDQCEEFIKICTQDNLNCIKASMTNMPFQCNSFDSIISIASFHHLSTKERRIQALKEMRRVLKDDGKILLSVWAQNQPESSKRKFIYGDNYVPWKSKEGIIQNRYYYIFEENEILNLFAEVNLKVVNYTWNYGNNIYLLEKF